jgi:general secretion pathway protein H
VAAAALLKIDRNAALRRQTEIVTQVDAPSRLIRSGATGRAVQMPSDIIFDALLSARCNANSPGRTIQFFPSGRSCGGVIALSVSSVTYEVRVNWLTGGVDVVALNQT